MKSIVRTQVALLFLSVGLSSLAAAAGPNPAPILIPNEGVEALASSGHTLYMAGTFTRFGPPTGHVVVVDRAGRVDPASPRVTGDLIDAIVPDGKGGWFIAGRFVSVGTTRCPNVAHIRANETLDASWCPSPDSDVRSLALSGRTLYVGGFFDTIRGKTRHLLAALDAQTGAILPWNPGVSGSGRQDQGDPRVAAIAVSGRTVYVGGVFDRVGGQPRALLAALDARSGRATAWNPNVTEPCDTLCGAVDDVAVSGRTVLVGGEFSRVGGKPRRNLAAIDAASGRPTAFNPAPNAEVLDLATAGRKLYLGGFFTRFARTRRVGVASVDLHTGRVLAWNAKLDTGVWALAATGTTIYVGGFFGKVGAQRRSGLAALDARSGRATAWNPDPDGRPSSAFAVVGNRIVVGGWFGSLGPAEARLGLAALDTTSGRLSTWKPDLSECDISCDKGMVATDSAVFLAGGFSRVNGETRRGLAALDLQTGRLLPWNPAAQPTDSCCDVPIAAAGSTIYVAGGFEQIGGQPREKLAAIDAATGRATPWNPQPDDHVNVITPAGPLVYVGGDFSRISGVPRGRVAAIDAATGQATPWDPKANDTVRAIAVLGQTIYVAGDFSRIGGAERNGLAAIDAVTGKATAWNPAPLYSREPDRTGVALLAIVGSTVVVGGDFFDRIGGVPRDRLAAIDADTGQVLPWRPELSYLGIVSALLPVGPTLYVGGYVDGHLLAFPTSDVTRSSAPTS